MTVTEPAPGAEDLNGKHPGALLCPECAKEGIVTECKSSLGLGAHRRHKHGVVGSSRQTTGARKTSGPRKAPGAPSDSAKAAAAGEDAGQIADQLRDTLRDLAARIQETRPRTADALRHQSGKVADAVMDEFRETSTGAALEAMSEGDRTGPIVHVGLTLLPVFTAYIGEVILPVIFAAIGRGPKLAPFIHPDTGQQVAMGGQPAFVNRKGELFIDGTGTGITAEQALAEMAAARAAADSDIGAAPEPILDDATPSEPAETASPLPNGVPSGSLIVVPSDDGAPPGMMG